MTDIDAMIPLGPSPTRRFYEMAVLLDCMADTYHKNAGAPDVPELEGVAARGRNRAYHCFVDKLGQICDSVKGYGAVTVTAFAILQPGGIEYRFASNSRSAPELNEVRIYVTDILDILRDVCDHDIRTMDTQSPVLLRILRKVIAFNRPRLWVYVQDLYQDLEFCTEKAGEEDTPEAQAASTSLRTLEHLVRFASKGEDNISASEWVQRAEALILAIDACYHSSLEDYLRTKPRNTSWDALHHAVGRLLSYLGAVQTIISARRFWPQLFVDFAVVAVPSSEPGDTPNTKRSADGIIKRMAGNTNPDVLDAFEAQKNQLQELGLDKMIKARVHPRKFMPIIHAELLVMDSVLRAQRRAAAEGQPPVRFFMESDFERYIGSSKPTCRLCALYVQEHPARFTVRQSHLNVYCKWRAPDVLKTDGAAVAAVRTAIIEAMIRSLRVDAFRAIIDRSLFRSLFDSNNTPTEPIWSTDSMLLWVQPAAAAADNDLESRMGNLSVRDDASVVSSRMSAPMVVERLRGDIERLRGEYLRAQVGEGIRREDEDEGGDDGGARL